MNATVLIATFLLTGLWHGAAWNFVIWGGYHGMLILATRALRGRFPEYGVASTMVGVLLTFVLINLGWLLFRADDLGIIWDSISGQFNGTAVGGTRVTAFLFFQVAVYSFPIWVFPIYQYLHDSRWAAHGIRAMVIGTPFRTGVAMTLFTVILVARSDAPQDFVYFQF